MKYIAFILGFILLLGIGVSAGIILPSGDTRFTQEEIDNIDFTQKDFDAEYSFDRNGDVIEGECSRQTGACYISLNISIYEEEELRSVQTLDGRDFIIENKTGDFILVEKQFSVKYFVSIIGADADRKGITYQEALIEHLDNEKDNLISTYRYRGENLLKSE